MPALQPSFRLNPAFQKAWREAIKELAEIGNKQSAESVDKLVRQSAKRFVRNIADITPPAMGTADSTAKQRGENAIVGDLLKLAQPVTVAGSTQQARELLATGEQLLAAHTAARINSSGRVNPRNRRDKLYMAQPEFNRVVKTLQKGVGFLAAALNAAADKLGFSLPAWIKRHGSKFGVIELKESAHGIHIRIIQNVPYVDSVRGYARHWDFALQREVKALVAQVKAIHHKHEQKAKAKFH